MRDECDWRQKVWNRTCSTQIALLPFDGTMGLLLTQWACCPSTTGSLCLKLQQAYWPLSPQQAHWLVNCVNNRHTAHSGPLVDTVQWACCWHSKPIDKTVDLLYTCCWHNEPTLDTVGLMWTHWCCCWHSGPVVYTVQWACCWYSVPVVETVDLLSKQWDFCGQNGLLSSHWACCRAVQ